MFDEGAKEKKVFVRTAAGSVSICFDTVWRGECFYSCLWPINLICNSSAGGGNNSAGGLVATGKCDRRRCGLFCGGSWPLVLPFKRSL